MKLSQNTHGCAVQGTAGYSELRHGKVWSLLSLHSVHRKELFIMKNKNTVIAVIVLIVLLAVAASCWYLFRPQTVVGTKEIVIEVTHKDGSVNTYELKTGQEYLYEALAEASVVGALENGYFVELDGEIAVTENEEWWGYTKFGEYVNYGINECAIEDGDHYEFTFNIGW